MKRIAVVLALGLVLVGTGWAENYFKSVSATVTSQTVSFRPSDGVMLCNDSGSANIAYVRLFTNSDVSNDAVGAATSAHSPIAIGACKSWGKTGGRDRWVAASIVSAGTSTVTVDAD